jgi:hypothetical protein
MDEKVSKTMDELMEYLLFEIKSRGLPTDEFRMQKLIFKNLYNQILVYFNTLK